MQCKWEKKNFCFDCYGHFILCHKCQTLQLLLILNVHSKESETALENCGSVEILAFEICNMGRGGSALQSFPNLNLRQGSSWLLLVFWGEGMIDRPELDTGCNVGSMCVVCAPCFLEHGRKEEQYIGVVSIVMSDVWRVVFCVLHVMHRVSLTCVRAGASAMLVQSVHS